MIARSLYSLVISLLFINCATKKDIYNTPTFSENGALQCIIEIPGGTNKKIEYHVESKTFEIDQRNGTDRVISFLPYPANYGFIPSTLSDRSLGGDGDALDILLISEALPTGTIIETIPIGMLKLLDNEQYDYKIICVPYDPEKRIIDVTTYAQFVKKYSKAKDIIESWFLHYDTGGDILISEGWGDEKEAFEEINKSLKH